MAPVVDPILATNYPGKLASNKALTIDEGSMMHTGGKYSHLCQYVPIRHSQVSNCQRQQTDSFRTN